MTHNGSQQGNLIKMQFAVRKLPDPAICRAIRTDGPGMVLCCVPQPRECQHVGFLDSQAYCLHPNREAIINRTP